MSFITCYSCGVDYSAAQFDGQYLAEYDWIMCGRCESRGRMADLVGEANR